MTAYETLWDFAEDHYGIVTTSQAVAMGIDKHHRAIQTPIVKIYTMIAKFAIVHFRTDVLK